MSITAPRPDAPRWALGLLALGLFAALLLNRAHAHSLRPDEAWLAWAIYYDPTEITGQRWQIDTLGDALRFIRDDVAQAWERLSAAPLPARLSGMLLNGWSLLAGESEVALRLPLVWAALLLGALGLRVVLAARWARRLMALVPLGMAALIALPLAAPTEDWRGFVAAVAERRAADQAAFVAWEPHSVIAYYDRRTPIRVGVSVDVGWRAFPPDELADLVARFDTYDQIWLLIDGRAELSQALFDLLDADRSLLWTHRERLAGFVAYRFQR
jgi:hypothetical protein